ncbi:type I methionyl aminopeptidase [Leadbetterella byssophila]|jgi:methionyl aminopeptidase|uniref:Methionine aminopeptidase n=1 Tax=Leadbetterella byssophila (strain DSM 17132 / JCM 16389 / KACC 11308 / NBRC 106382 / 4M15) TaxID=649349 RepID=E4RQD8_LEAB4|nr:type I methionyl aminopeptidase [Leadbetterella byssophila]ADQ18346.1 methionine aminopeptidase, type I [Leadbetterella byssophila DSM 17132]
MSISEESELEGMKAVGHAVAYTLSEMRKYAQVGMSTYELDQYGAQIMEKLGAKSAPKLTYGFPGYACISTGGEFCHGIPSKERILTEGELINIDVSAELNGFWADNGCSFVLGEDIHGHQALVNASKEILQKTIKKIKGGVRIADIGHFMEMEAKRYGYKVIRNLGGHGVGRSLHEQPDELMNYKQKDDQRRFRKHSVVAIETFIATHSTIAVELNDGWTMVGNKGGFMAQHEHTLMVTEDQPLIFTEANGIFE